MPAKFAGKQVRRSKAPIWTIVATIAATVVVVVIVVNFNRPEKKIDHQVRHLFGTADPQFEREMGTLLGPAILSGNRITALQNGDEIFPAMLKAIHAAKHTIDFESYIYWSGAYWRGVCSGAH
jgi:cardiolipin synthase